MSRQVQNFININLRWSCFVFAIISACPQVSYAKDQVPVQTKFDLEYYAILSGPSLGSLGSPYQTNPKTSQIDHSLPQSWLNQFKFNYYFAPDAFVGPVIDLNLVLGNDNSDSVVQDIGYRVGTSNLLGKKDLIISADLRFLIPVSTNYRNLGMTMTIQTWFMISYNPARSPFYFGLNGIERFQSFKSPMAEAPDFDLYFGPSLFVKASENLYPGLIFDYYPAHSNYDSSWSQSQPSDLDLSLAIYFSKNISLVPGFLYYPAYPSFENIGTLMYIYAKIP